MDRTTRFKGVVYLSILLGVLLSFVLFAWGCSGQQLKAAQDARDAAHQVLTDGQKAVADLKAHLATMPSDDPGRPALELLLAKAEKYLDKAEKSFPLIDGVIKGTQTGDFTDPALTAVLKNVPYGAYIISALSVIGFLARNGQLGKAKDALSTWQAGFAQVVDSIEHAFPERTPEQKLAMSAVQDESTRRLVDAVKSS